MFNAAQGYNDNGTFICVTCFESRQLTSAVRDSAASIARAKAVPAYQGIVKGANILKGYATYLMVIAVICFIASVGIPVLELAMSEGHVTGPVLLTAISTCIIFVSIGVFYLIVSRLVMMLGELAMAHRDIARNSF
jgi:hypothetical protein